MTTRYGRTRTALSIAVSVCLLAAAVPALGVMPAITGLGSSTHAVDDSYYAEDSPEFSWDAASDLPKLLGTYDPTGVVADVAVAGDVAYLAVETGDFLMVDISEPGTMTLLGHRDRPSGNGYDIAIAGDVAYVAEGQNGLYMQDITVPTGPTPPMGFYDTPGTAMGVALAGDVAYVADLWGGLQAIDISEPGTPTLLGTYATAGNALDVAVEGDVAYVCVNLTAYEDAVEAVDISEPGTMTPLGIQETAERSWRVAVSGDVAYVGTDHGLQAVDVSEPTSMSMLGVCETPLSARDVTVDGDTAYVADYRGFAVIDVSDSSAPTLLGYHETLSDTIGVAVAGGVAYVADRHAGLHAFQVAESGTLTQMGSYDTPEYALGVALSGDVAFVADYTSGLITLDMSEPGTPTLLGTYDTPGHARCVAISGDVGYVADGASGILALDISEPGTPTPLASYDTPGYARGVAVSGDVAYVADGASGVVALDISEPGAFSWLDTFDTPGYAYGVAVGGDALYVADGTSGLRTLDVSDPANLASLGTYDTSGEVQGVALHGDAVFVADYNAGVVVLDVADPGVPTWLGSYASLTQAQSIAIAGDVALVANGQGGLYGLEISDPSTPTLLGSAGTPDRARCVAVAGDIVAVADDTSGLQVFDVADAPIAYSYDVDQSAATNPDRIPDTPGTSASSDSLTDGTWWFHVRGVGLRREAGATSHRRVMIDSTEPSTTVQAPSDWLRSADISLSATDALSGVSDTYYWVDTDSPQSYSTTVTVATNGIHTFNYYSEDKALPANIESTKQVLVYIDRQPPETTSDAVGTYYGDAAISLEASDSASGVSSTYWSIDGGPEQEYTGPITFEGGVFAFGEHELSYYSVDALGNTESFQSDLFDLFSDSADFTPISGTNRYDTAIRTSKAAFAAGTADCVVIATGENWPDALGGAALASAKNGPILLTAPEALSAGIIREIRRLGADEAVILGSTDAVSGAVEDALEAELGDSDVSRIQGTDRYKTAQAIASAAIAELGAGYDGTAFVSTGADFPDALAASPISAARVWPIFLADPAGNPPTGVMKRLGVTDALILGGESAVSGAQEGVLDSAFGGARVDRLSGRDRYATAVAVASYGVNTAGLAWDGLAMATGEDFPDALAGGVLAGKKGTVMLLTDSTVLPTSVRKKLAARRDWIADVYYLGGTGAISQGVRDAVAAVLH